MSDVLSRALALLDAHLPANATRARMRRSPGDVAEADERAIKATLMLERLDEQGQIDDVIEQQVAVLYVEDNQDPARALVELEATLRALPALLDAIGASTALPSELFGLARFVDAAVARTADALSEAMTRDAAAVIEASRDEDLRSVLEGSGLEHQARALRALERDAIRLHLEPDVRDEGSGDDVPLGESRFGGAPDLPIDWPWPECDGEPMTFVAQIALAELRAFDAANELPAEGTLSFFFAPGSMADDGTTPVRVFHWTADEQLERRATPTKLESLAAHTIAFARESMVPGVESPFYESLADEQRVLAFRRALATPGNKRDVASLDPTGPIANFIELYNREDSTRPIHRMLGYASNIQGDPYRDLEVGLRPGGYDAYREGTLAALETHRASRRWRLLLQIDASNDGELLLPQDGGYFYFWLTDEALARSAFEACVGTLQCH